MNIQILLLACFYSSPAAWAKDFLFDTCFRIIASFGDPQYLPRTSPQSAWISRIWSFEFRKTLLPRRNLSNIVPCRGLDPCPKGIYRLEMGSCEHKVHVHGSCTNLNLTDSFIQVHIRFIQEQNLRRDRCLSSRVGGVTLLRLVKEVSSPTHHQSIASFVVLIEIHQHTQIRDSEKIHGMILISFPGLNHVWCRPPTFVRA